MIVRKDRTPDHIDAVALGEGEYETIVLDATVNDMKAAGYGIGDLVRVSIGDDEFTVTYVRGYADVGVMGGFASASV